MLKKPCKVSQISRKIQLNRI